MPKFEFCQFGKRAYSWRPFGLDRDGTVEHDVNSTSGRRGVGNPGIPAGVLLTGESLPFRVSDTSSEIRLGGER